MKVTQTGDKTTIDGILSKKQNPTVEGNKSVFSHPAGFKLVTQTAALSF